MYVYIYIHLHYQKTYISIIYTLSKYCIQKLTSSSQLLLDLLTVGEILRRKRCFDMNIVAPTRGEVKATCHTFSSSLDTEPS